MQRIRLSCKARYRLAIRNAYTHFEEEINDELYSRLIITKFLISGKAGMQNLGKMLMHMSLLTDIQVMLIMLMYLLITSVRYTTSQGMTLLQWKLSD